MSETSSDPPEKPSECPTEGNEDVYRATSDDVQPSHFDIENMKILFVQDNTNFDPPDEGKKLDDAMQTVEIPQDFDHILQIPDGEDKKRTENGKLIKTKPLLFLTFDLQNTFALPKAYIGHYYYKQKLSCYNLTGYCSLNNTVYNAIRHEYICGRARTHIANAIVKILKAVICDNLNLKKVILWSDSCVPQNRNSIFPFAMQNFLNSEDSGNLELIEHKYSEPGHGNLQGIDCAHSCIERFIKHLEIWSPLTLIRILIHMPTTWRKKFKVMQMQLSNYMDYQKSSSLLNYQVLPYSKVKRIVYDKNSIMNIKFSESFEGNLKKIKVIPKKNTRRDRITTENTMLTVNRLTDLNIGLTEEKKKAITEMLLRMPEIEREFYHAILSKPAKKKEMKKRKIMHPKIEKFSYFPFHFVFLIRAAMDLN
ncbi:unnamed protein product [Phaedon cochleariae]|uniref:Uncharacterized protein n=1 Tax=Phaedon cochleariae TaxID=80249 RepID=A0A9P0DEE7_PHACE|nr:unnamed protein product [Phaedon cochleariae]